MFHTGCWNKGLKERLALCSKKKLRTKQHLAIEPKEVAYHMQIEKMKYRHELQKSSQLEKHNSWHATTVLT